MSFESSSVSSRTTRILLEASLSIEWLLWNLSKNHLTNAHSNRYSNNRQSSSLATHTNLDVWTSKHQCIWVEQGTCLPSARRVELEVHCDDDRWSHLQSTKKIGTGFSVICWFCRFRLSPFALNFSTDIFTPYKLFPLYSGYSEFVVSPWPLCCTICDGEYEFIIFLSDQYDSSRLMCPTFPDLPHLPSEYLLSKLSPRSAHSPEWFLVILSCQIDEFSPDLSVKTDDLQTIAPKGIIGPLNGSSNRLSQGVFPSARRSWTFRR